MMTPMTSCTVRAPAVGQAVTRLRESLHPPYLIMGAGTMVAVAMGFLGTQALVHSQDLRQKFSGKGINLTKVRRPLQLSFYGKILA